MITLDALAPADVVVHGVHKSYGGHTVLAGVDLTVKPGEVTVILGPSGSGKSTLLRAINHLEKVDRGYVSVDGEPIGYRRLGDRLHELREREILRQRRRIGFVFQNFNLFPHLTVLDNVVEAPVCDAGPPPSRGGQALARDAARPGRVLRTRPTPTPASCPAASSSASRSPGPWRCDPA